MKNVFKAARAMANRIAGPPAASSPSAPGGGDVVDALLKPPLDLNDDKAVLEYLRTRFAPQKGGANGDIETVPVRLELITAVCKTVESDIRKLLSDEDSARLRVLDKEWCEATDAANAHGRDEAVRQFKKQQGGQSEATDYWSKGELMSDFSLRRQAWRAKARAASLESAAIMRRTVDIFIGVFTRLSEEEALADFKRHARWGIDFQPNLVVGSLLASGRALTRYVEKAATHGNVRPATMWALVAISL